MPILEANDIWITAREFDREAFTPAQWEWFTHRGSLTQKLRDHFSEKIQLHLKSQAWALPYKDEAFLLGISADEPALIRTVHWLIDDKPKIKARVIIPKCTTLGPGHELLNMGTRSLGDVLFADPYLKRSEFLFKQRESYLSRRCIFHYHTKPLLVQEDFLIDSF